ncbi:DUF2783 domain-containing protein [Marinobacterium arenosum]|uniref:DUF2783 domain-containing protein n=1 Tax=Marinobacterium arenosum TaxID=2862496 RepID=UPI001C960FB7|nr:DUF2783 domain-containing protein [Marinobacterium arenosum]MBY4678413.1 DUF2783 domain-containing protein [Marinobacterium arenosum]
MTEQSKAEAMAVADLEQVYDALAEAIDRAGEAHDRLFLTKLVLLLANRCGDRQAVLEAIDAALQDL